MNDWSREMGEMHRQRDQAASSKVQALVDSEKQQHTVCLRRWPSLVGAITTLITSYNKGVGQQALTVVEGSDPDQPGVTLASGGPGHSTLVIALEGAELSVRKHGGQTDPGNSQHWIDLHRTDEDTAAYLLQNWMERL